MWKRTLVRLTSGGRPEDNINWISRNMVLKHWIGSHPPTNSDVNQGAGVAKYKYISANAGVRRVERSAPLLAYTTCGSGRICVWHTGTRAHHMFGLILYTAFRAPCHSLDFVNSGMRNATSTLVASPTSFLATTCPEAANGGSITK